LNEKRQEEAHQRCLLSTSESENNSPDKRNLLGNKSDEWVRPDDNFHCESKNKEGIPLSKYSAFSATELSSLDDDISGYNSSLSPPVQKKPFIR